MTKFKVGLIGAVLALTLSGANVALQGNGCRKDCGGGSETGRGERESGECAFDQCFWVSCEVAFCTSEYGNCNDNCFSYLECRPVPW